MMNYTDLINPDNLAYAEDVFNQKPEETFTIRRAFLDNSFFISFIPKQWKNKHPKSLFTNWKARLSIHSEDFDKAWGIIFPTLCEKHIAYKVANRSIIEKFKNARQRELETLIFEYNLFLHNFNIQDTNFLRAKVYQLFQDLGEYNYSKWRFMAFVKKSYQNLGLFFNLLRLNKENLVTYTKNLYERLINLNKKKAKNSLRFYEGMQWTIYILPGFEKECQLMLEKIEDDLLKEGIRSGTIYPTDRKIGVYSSIRHPGKSTYHKATGSNLETYNPDNIDDPFDFLGTIPADEIMQESEAQAIIKHANSSELIIIALRTRKFIAPSILKALSVNKENIVEYVKTLPLEQKRELITDCLDKSTNLGAFFRVQRGLFAPKLGHGTLKQIENISLTNELVPVYNLL